MNTDLSALLKSSLFTFSDDFLQLQQQKKKKTLVNFKVETTRYYLIHWLLL